MARNREPVLKRARALGIEPAYMGYNKKSNRHPAVSRKKKSEYGIQLNEKQKVKFLYGLSETQFRNTYEKVLRDLAELVRTFLSCSSQDSTT